MKKLLCCIIAIVMLTFGFAACQPKQQPVDNDIAFKYSELELEIGESVQAEVITSKENVYVNYSMRDPEIATISSRGVITAISAGETVCYAKFGGKTVMCLVKVKGKSAVPELSVLVPYYNNQVTMYAGRTLNLNATVKLGDASVTDATLGYAVGNAQIASVENGVLTALSTGNTTVTITATYNGQTATAVVTVQVTSEVKPVESITVSGQTTTFNIGDKFVFGGTVDVRYTDGTTESNVDYYTIDTSDFDSTKTGTCEIVVIVGDATQPYNVTVIKGTKLKF